MKGIKTMDDFSFEEKRVLIRVDLNSPVVKGSVQMSDRLREHAKTIKELSEKGAMVIVLAHQGRPGSSDFLSLKQHAALLSRLVPETGFVNDTCGSKAISEIRKLGKGDVLLLQNTRMCKENDLPKRGNLMVKRLAPMFDIFVLDALSVAHRKAASITGFAKALPSCMGRVMQKELVNIDKLIKNIRKPYIMVLGGMKPDDYFGLMEKSLRNKQTDKILLCGAVGELFLMADGVRLGKTEDFLKDNGINKGMARANKMLKKHKKRIMLPLDVAIEKKGKRKEMKTEQLPSESMIYDIGRSTIKLYTDLMKKSGTVFMKGTPGAYEKSAFGIGTKALLKAMNESRGFSFLGGGHSSEAIDYFKVNKKKIDYISLSGGALLRYMSGEKLPGIEALRKGKKR